MYSKQHKTAITPVNYSNTPAPNQFAPRNFVIQPQAEVDTPQQEQTQDVQASSPNLAKISTFPPNYQPAPARVQMKLTIGQPGDKYEQEAEKVAADVVQQIHSPANNRVQPQETREDEDQLQTKLLVQCLSVGDGMSAKPDLEASIQQARGRGQPLADSIREPMEQSFGTDFSQVKVHTDTQSDQLNQSIQAKAFTTGQDIFFRQGAYNPGSREGQELMAHELTHVVQQNGSLVQQKQENTGIKDVSSATISSLEETVSGNFLSTEPEIQPNSRHILQRTTWRREEGKFGKWIDESDNTTELTDVPTMKEIGDKYVEKKVPPAAGDLYDDVAHNLYTSSNVKYSEYGNVEDKDNRLAKLKAATAQAKQHLDRATNAVNNIISSNDINAGGQIKSALPASFPFTEKLSDDAIVQSVLPTIYMILNRMRSGMDSTSAEIAMVGSPKMFDIQHKLNQSQYTGLAGWVKQDDNEVDDPYNQKSLSVFTRSSPIYLQKRGEEPWTIVHEASHKFAATVDFQYSSYEKEIREDEQVAQLLDLYSQPESDEVKEQKRLETIEQIKENHKQRLAERGVREWDKNLKPAAKEQSSWYGMGRRALMNADSYAQLVMTSTGKPIPQSLVADQPHELGNE